MRIFKRKHTRIDLPLLVKTTFYDNPNNLFLVKNISLSGIFIVTHLNIITGTKCLIELNSNQPDELITREVYGIVARQSDNGFGIQFIRMDHETYMILQTKLLYSCNDPFALCQEFSSDWPVAIKGEMVHPASA